MHVISAMNVRDALPKAVRYVLRFGKPEDTRNGEALVAIKPITILYNFPKQHVLTNAIRDANPFFHLIEAMWMLAGRNDGAFLDYYIKGFSDDFGDKNGIIPDAYGYRWRQGLPYDQLHEIIGQLKKNPNTRQCVLQMWGAGRDDLRADMARPCNLIVTFRIVDRRLNMTVFNRSNDLIWGCCGANAVHFPIMQEYVAGMVGIPMGPYWQISTNLHLYTNHREMLAERALKERALIRPGDLASALVSSYRYEDTQPLVTYPEAFDEEVFETMRYIDDLQKDEEGYDGTISNGFLREVVIPMAEAHHHYKKKQYKEAFETIKAVTADDWRKAGREWLERHSGSVRR